MEDIEGYEGLYQVSNLGRVKSRVRVVYGKILKPGKSGSGYHNVTLCSDVNKLCQVHRLVAAAFCENPENKPWVNHKNGIKTDNRSENLEWVTPSENSFHAIETGLKAPSDKQRKIAIEVNSGENSHNCVLSDFDVYEIRRVYANGGISMKKLGNKFGCSPGNVWSIVNNKTRKAPTPVLEKH